MLAWPNQACTVFGSIPLDSQKVAAVWRRSWMRRPRPITDHGRPLPLAAATDSATPFGVDRPVRETAYGAGSRIMPVTAPDFRTAPWPNGLRDTVARWTGLTGVPRRLLAIRRERGCRRGYQAGRDQLLPFAQPRPGSVHPGLQSQDGKLPTAQTLMWERQARSTRGGHPIGQPPRSAFRLARGVAECVAISVRRSHHARKDSMSFNTWAASARSASSAASANASARRSA
jgi:hypothetical protein